MIRRRRSRNLLPAVAALMLSASSVTPAVAVDDPVGVWTLSSPGTARSCRLQFRADSAATGQAVAIPPGCRHAFPILAPVRSWSLPDGVHLALSDENGANVLMFGDMDDGGLQAAGAESEAAYVLTPLKPRKASSAPATAKPAAEAAMPAAASPALPPVSAASVAGHYAVMRGARDTGCMVTLDDPGSAASATMKARLAPACRDQGIIIFDPVGWAVKAGHLVLAARKGHTAAFSQDEAGIWVKDPKSGQPLGLKRL